VRTGDGAFDICDYLGDLQAARRNSRYPPGQWYSLGFRVGEVPEPAAGPLLAFGGYGRSVGDGFAAVRMLFTIRR